MRYIIKLLIVAFVLALGFLNGPSSWGAGATQLHLDWNFDVNPGPFPPPIPPNPGAGLEWALEGDAGTLHGHVVIIRETPFKENASFTLHDFEGSLTISGPAVVELGLGCSEISLQTIQPTDAKVQLHYGPEPSKPLFAVQCDPSIAILCDGIPIGTVRFARIVGGQILLLR